MSICVRIYNWLMDGRHDMLCVHWNNWSAQTEGPRKSGEYVAAGFCQCRPVDSWHSEPYIWQRRCRLVWSPHLRPSGFLWISVCRILCTSDKTQYLLLLLFFCSALFCSVLLILWNFWAHITNSRESNLYSQLSGLPKWLWAPYLRLSNCCRRFSWLAGSRDALGSQKYL